MIRMTDDRSTPPRDLVAFRHDIERRFAIPPVAYSAERADGGGQRATHPRPAGRRLRCGGARGDGDRIVVSVRSLTLDERIGPQIDFDDDAVESGLGLPGATINARLRGVAGEAAVLGRLRMAAFVPAASSSRSARNSSARRHRRKWRPCSMPSTVRRRPSTSDACGTSPSSRPACDRRASPGTRSCAASRARARPTRRACCSNDSSAGSTLRVSCSDPNTDHVHLGALADPDNHAPEAERYRAVASEVARCAHADSAATTTLCIDFSDLDPHVRAALLQLDPIADLDLFAALTRDHRPPHRTVFGRRRRRGSCRRRVDGAARSTDLEPRLDQVGALASRR